MGGIAEWLRLKANGNLGRARTIAGAIKAGDGLSEEVMARFGAEAPAVDPDILDKAARGELGREAPSAKLIAAAGILKWTAFLSEIFLFLVLWIMGFGNPILVLMGMLLALSGYATGYGVGAILVTHESNGGFKNLKGWLFTLFGLAGGTTLAWLRSRGAEEGQLAAVLIPMILVLAIALFEALHMTLSHKYNFLRDQMYKAQVWFAIEQQKKNSDSGLWRTIYEREVQTFAKRTDVALQEKAPPDV
ncbi:MAG TPA: hypothetical protein VHR45_25855 [Thermoanaerobaculia bacterium]|nr:hypothetical protein [Thermoanaerobaculia bacterium]